MCITMIQSIIQGRRLALLRKDERKGRKERWMNEMQWLRKAGSKWSEKPHAQHYSIQLNIFYQNSD